MTTINISTLRGKTPGPYICSHYYKEVTEVYICVSLKVWTTFVHDSCLGLYFGKGIILDVASVVTAVVGAAISKIV